MTHDASSLRYAEALGSTVKDISEGQASLGALTRLVELTRAEPQFGKFLESPAVAPAEKLALAQKLLPQAPKVVSGFLRVVLENSRIRELPSIRDAFQHVVDQKAGVVRVRAVSSAAMNEAQKNKLTQKLSKAAGKSVILEVAVDPAILGGLMITADGKEIDGSIRGRLKRLRKELVKWRPGQTK